MQCRKMQRRTTIYNAVAVGGWSLWLAGGGRLGAEDAKILRFRSLRGKTLTWAS